MLLHSILGTLFTWAMTAAGAALVFVIPGALKYRGLQQKLLDGSLGFAGGVMLAASYFSLLAPAIEVQSPTARAARPRPAGSVLANALDVLV